MIKISPITERRIKRFLKIKRAWISLLILSIFYLISLFSEFIVNDKPILIKYNNKLYFFAAYKFYSDKTFGGKYDTEVDYKEKNQSFEFKNNKGNFMIFPIIPYGPYKDDLKNLKGYPPAPPDLNHLLGTDDRGRDVLARLLYGFRVSMTFSLLLLVLEIVIGIIIGGIQGYFGSIVDITFQRIIEIISALPFLYIVILVGHTIGKGFIMLIVVISLFNWIGLSYYIRSEFLKVKQFQFVEAAKAMGASNLRILFLEILPNAITPIISFAPFSVIAGISTLSSLDFLGFGLPAPTPSWGELIRQGTENLNCYWLSIFPFIALFLTLLLTAFIGEGLREALNPSEYSKYE